MQGLVGLFIGALRLFLTPLFAYLKGKADAKAKYEQQERKKIANELKRLNRKPVTRADTHRVLLKWAKIIESSQDTSE